MNILVLCTGNSARSILLEALLNRHGAERITAFSAGSNPTGVVHPQSLKLLASKGYECAGLRSKSWDEFAADDAPQIDLVITVCGSAAAEQCPIWPGSPIRAHWGVEDPAATQPEAWEEAFEEAYNILERRGLALLALPFETMDREKLSASLQDIAGLS